MTTATRTPQLRFRYFDSNGFPLSGGKVYTYAVGSTTPAVTYTDYALTTQNTNPVVLNIAGEAQIFLPYGVGFKFIVTDPNDAVLTTEDNVYGNAASNSVTGNSGGGPTGIWIASISTPTYVSPQVLTIPGNETGNFSIGTRIKYVVLGSIGYGTILDSSYTSPLTTITVQRDLASILLDPTISAVYWGSTSKPDQRIVDAGSVSYTAQLPYNTPDTVGYQLHLLQSKNSVLQSVSAVPATTATLGTEGAAVHVRALTGPRLYSYGGKIATAFTGNVAITVDDTTIATAASPFNYFVDVTTTIYIFQDGVSNPVSILGRQYSVTLSGKPTYNIDVSMNGIYDTGGTAGNGYTMKLNYALRFYATNSRPDTNVPIGSPAPYFTPATSVGRVTGQFSIVEL
jgi:hypothetical protein